jgi:hypothetical protein
MVTIIVEKLIWQNMKPLKILGINVTGREENPTGICVLNNQKVILKSLYTNAEIFEEIKKSSIDPLNKRNFACILTRHGHR